MASIINENPLLFVLSGPSGVGKDAVLNGLKMSETSLYFAVTATTRKKRAGEIDGKDYIFVSQPEFEKMIERNELLEWANVYGNYYGVPKSKLQKALADGVSAIVKVDVQGAETIRSVVPEAVLIFVAPPSMEELDRRLRKRKTESGIDLDLRTKAAHKEMKKSKYDARNNAKKLPLFDYVVINYDDQVERAVSQIKSIITAEKCRIKARTINIT